MNSFRYFNDFKALEEDRHSKMARVTGLEPATSGVTGRHSNQLSYTRAFPVTKYRNARLDKPERSVKQF